LSPVAEWFLFLPQVRLPVPDIVGRAQAAESSGFDGVAFIDHLETPALADQNIWEAMSIAAWVAAKTDRIQIGHLVLCNAFRHPAVLAKQAVTLSAASGGRFELGLGSGSWPQELSRFGIGSQDAASRVQQLDRDLGLIEQYWGRGQQTELTQAPIPSYPIPLVLGGTGPRTMTLVRRYADWWNLPAPQIDQLPRLLPSVGSARVSVQQMVGFVGRGSDPDAVREQSTRRFAHLGPGLVCGDAPALVEHFATLSGQGVERFYVWFADFAPPATIEEFGNTVISAFGH
jgi:alkanesulfonate monooxygenase SsuD/methylene tetrahydromethanopterin reductase-like flavin-dependent oxidoreductase (luciferase family)